jgi:hypothetical protein
VIVGVIDTGIWPEHPSFADDGTYPDLPITPENTPENPLCNFGDITHNLYDAPFTCNNKLIGARQMLIDKTNKSRIIEGCEHEHSN